MRKLYLLILILTIADFIVQAKGTEQKPIRLAVAGMSHGHISFILKRPDKGDFKLVGYYEPNKELVKNLSRRFEFHPDLVYSELTTMLDETNPEAVVAFGSIYDHLAVVKACALRGIHIMVEKPLAVNMKHAKKMAKLAKKHDIYLLTNYETSWYPTTVKSLQMVLEDDFTGPLRKVVVHDGHKGPKEIGVSNYFLSWLTDPVLNGGGALVDFGCYGANLMTALTEGKQPLSVTAVIRQFKPDVYPEVDDEATIIVSYPESQCIIQASWNWPFSRKDMEIYGTKGYIKADNKNEMRIRGDGMKSEEIQHIADEDVEVYVDPFAYFADVINGRIEVEPYSVYSLENNLRVVEILDAARKSAQKGKTINLK